MKRLFILLLTTLSLYSEAQTNDRVLTRSGKTYAYDSLPKLSFIADSVMSPKLYRRIGDSLSTFRTRDTAVFYGTSITQGAFASTGENRYVNIVAKYMFATLSNRGIPGSTLQHNPGSSGDSCMVDRIGSIPAYNATTHTSIFFEYGTNDYHQLSSFTDTAGFRAAYNRVLDSTIVNRLYPKANITLISPGYDISGGFTEPQRLYCIRQVREIAAAKGVNFADVDALMTSEGKFDVLNADGLHPNDKGHRIYAMAILNSIKRGHATELKVAGTVITNYLNINANINDENKRAPLLVARDTSGGIFLELRGQQNLQNFGIGFNNQIANLPAANGNTSIGHEAMKAITTGTNSTAIGRQAMTATTTGSGTAIGSSALAAQTTGSGNTAIGTNTLLLLTTSNNNTGVGNGVLVNNTAGDNTAIGQAAMAFNTSGSENVAIGKDALNKNTTASNIVAIGTKALQNSTTASFNVAIGYEALLANTTASFNTGIGFRALKAVTTNQFNVGIGHNAGGQNTGSNNTAIGSRALESNTSSTNGTTAIGYFAGNGSISGGANIFIGNEAGNNAAYASVSNRLLIGNTSGTTNLVDGVMGGSVSTQSLTINGSLDVVGGLKLQTAAKTGAYTVTVNDYTIEANGTFTVTLPAASTLTKAVFIVKNTGAGVITVSSASNIDGVGSKVYNTQYSGATFQSNGTTWSVIGTF